MAQDDPDQLTSLIEAYALDKHCLAAAELDYRDAKHRAEEAEARVKHWVGKVDGSYQRVRRRIDAQTDSAFDDDREELNRRCLALLQPGNCMQFVKTAANKD